MTAELTIVPAQQQLSMFDRIADPMAAIVAMGEFMASSGIFGCKKKEQGMVIAMACFCERKNPLEIAQTYHLIETEGGMRLSMKADAILARYMASGGKVAWKQFDSKGAVADWTYDGKTVSIGFVEEDAKRALLLPAHPKSGWAKYPDAMYRARLISKAVRMLCPAACMGAYTPEELTDAETVPSVVPVVADVQKPAPVKPAPEPTPALKQVASAPVKPPAPAPKVEPKAAPVITIPNLTADEKVNIECARAVIEAMKDDAGKSMSLKAMNFLLDGPKQLLKPGEPLECLPQAAAIRIGQVPDAFIMAVKNWKQEPTTK